MTKTIAIAGKGGTGKTTIAALLIQYLATKGKKVLAIDADPSTNLNIALGVPLEDTVGDIREEALQQIKGGMGSMSRQDYLELRINEALVEAKGFDLLAMGRPEGPGCYCAANYVLRLCIDRLGDSYDYVVIDNEAGLEHISRRTTRNVDLLLLVSDPTVRGLIAAERAARLVQDLDSQAKDVRLIINRTHDDQAMRGELRKLAEERNLKLAGFLPEDPLLATFEMAGRPLVELPPEAKVRRGLQEIIASLPDLV